MSVAPEGVTSIGEYSVAPELSPIGNVNKADPEYVFLTEPPPDANIIRVEEAPEIVDDEPKLRLFEPRSRFPFVKVSVPFIEVAPLNEASVPPD